MILSRDALQNFEMIIDFQLNMIVWQELKIPMKDPVELCTNEQLLMVFTKTLEPEAIKSSNKHVTCILDAKYEKADLEHLVCEECSHLSTEDQHKLLKLLLEYEGLFDSTLGDFKTDPISLDIKPGKKLAYTLPYLVPKVHKTIFKKELDQLVKLGVLEKDNDSPWASPAFIISKKNGMVRFLINLHKVNAKIK